MSPAPQRGTPAADATLEIRALARQGRGDVQALQTLYVLECLLARISASVYREDFVLKGGVLLAAYALRRPTKDIDVNVTRLDADVESVASRVRSVCEIDLPDGVVFDVSSIAATPIRDDDQYGGVRVRVSAGFGTARIKIGVDVSFGDPIWPAPVMVEVPRVVDLGLEPLQMLGYPLTMVLAEKIVTAASRGEANTRWRDFADICTIARTHPIRSETLGSSISEVARYRQVEMRSLRVVLETMPEVGQTGWASWRQRLGRTDLPEGLADVVAEVSAFADPAISGTAGVGAQWVPGERSWRIPVDAIDS